MARDLHCYAAEIEMLTRCADAVVLGFVSVIYSIAVLLLKQRKA